MGYKDIIIIIVIAIVVLSIIGVFIYKKAKGLPTGQCACCHTRMKKAIKKACCDVKNEKN